MKVKYIFWSWDFIISIICSLITYVVLPYWINSTFAKDIYSVGISVLSIVFSVFFAALAIIMSSSDDDFVSYLEQKGHYTIIIESFQFSLAVLFIALIYAVGIYSFTSYWLSVDFKQQQNYWFIIFVFLFFYGMLAAASSTINAITYSKYRSKYLNSGDNKIKDNQN